MAKPSSVNDIYGAHLMGGRFPGLTRGHDDSSMFQRRIELLLINKLIELSCNRFKWKNLPVSVDPRYLELTMFYQGLSVFYYDTFYNKHFALPGTGGHLDMYNNPLSYRVAGNQMINKQISRKDCVPIYANYTRKGEFETVLVYASRLAKLDTTIDINTMNARQPRILATTENTRLTMENFNRQIDAGVPTIKVDDSFNPNASVQVFDMGVDADLFDKLGITRTRLWNECMSMLGIKNANQDKKERLVADEVSANDEQVGYMRAVNLNARQYAAREINRRFGLNVSVDYDDDIFTGALATDEPETSKDTELA